MELDEYRKSIDDIDKELISLFEKRMMVSIKIAEYKKENSLPVLNSEREAIVLRKAAEAVLNEENKGYAQELSLIHI